MMLIFFFISISVGESVPYFQQHVAYDIDVTLNDSLHTLNAYEKILYTNNSPDTLDFIWFHLWPNAYKNTETAAAKQAERFLSSKFIFTKEKDRGYIDSLDFIDSVYGIGKLIKYSIDAIKKDSINKAYFPDKKTFIEYFSNHKKKYNVIYIKGSRSMKLENIISGLFEVKC